MVQANHFVFLDGGMKDLKYETSKAYRAYH